MLLVDGIEVSARPSDAIALALRVGSDIYCAEDVSMRPASRFQKPKMTRWRSSGNFSIRSIPTTSSLVKSQSPSQRNTQAQHET